MSARVAREWVAHSLGRGVPIMGTVWVVHSAWPVCIFASTGGCGHSCGAGLSGAGCGLCLVAFQSFCGGGCECLRGLRASGLRAVSDGGVPIRGTVWVVPSVWPVCIFASTGGCGHSCGAGLFGAGCGLCLVAFQSFCGGGCECLRGLRATGLRTVSDGVCQ